MLNPKILLPKNNDTHTWSFSRVGGVNRVNLDTGLDLVHLEDLDQKLWTALSCPVYGLEIDFKTLELIDKDKDERIRVPEIIDAVKWVTSLIKNPDSLAKQNKSLPLSMINDSTEEGKKLLISAHQILTNLGRTEQEEITVEETSDTAKIFANTKFNGDGIITDYSAEDDSIKELIRDIIDCMGSVKDISGKDGISADHINDFYRDCENYSDWYAKAESNPDKLFPFGDLTADAFASFVKIKAKIEDYFLRCRLSEFDPDSSDILNSLDSRVEEIRDKDLTLCNDEIAAFPLAKINPEKSLSLTSGLNPVWEKAIADFKILVINPIFPGKENITEKDLEIVRGKFKDYNVWQSEKVGSSVEKLGLTKIRFILSGKTKEALFALIYKDKSLEDSTNSIFLVDKLVRYYRDLYTLLKNYVTFYDFYSPDTEAIFQAGKLFIDQRCCDLCLKVRDMNKHNTLARTSGLCLIYCDCYSKTRSDRMTIVAALTDGDFYNIDIGRNAIFYDREGNDWDATIIKIVDNPISIRQAFWSPYRKVSKFISNQVEKIASAKDKEIENVATSNIEKTTGKVDSGIKDSLQSPQVVKSPPANPPQPFDIGKFVGIFAAIGLALGAIGSVVASILTGFLGLSWWKMPLALLGIILAISGPSMIIGWLKLRKRNLAPLLDANGWAINARATINIAFGNTLTHIAVLPENSKLNLIDPFAKKKNPLIPIILILIVILGIAGYLLWHLGYLGKWGII
jgi:hypothetical protein